MSVKIELFKKGVKNIRTEFRATLMKETTLNDITMTR